MGHEIIKAMQYLRDNKILHRDIKPQNMMLDQQFHIKIMDFGLSVSSDHFEYEIIQNDRC